MDAPEYTVHSDPETWARNSTVHVVGQIGDWTVFASVVPSLRFAITELRVFPAEGQLPRGRYLTPENERGEWTGRTFDIPEGGIPWRNVLRQVRERDIQRVAREWVEGARKYLADHGLTDSTLDTVAARIASNDARDDYVPPTPVQRLAKLAGEYVDLLDTDDAHRPNAVLAERYGRTPGWVATELHRARKHDLLTETKRGKPGGSLTPRGRDIVNQLNNQKEDR